MGDLNNSHKMVRSKSSWDYTGDRATSASSPVTLHTVNLDYYMTVDIRDMFAQMQLSQWDSL